MSTVASGKKAASGKGAKAQTPAEAALGELLRDRKLKDVRPDIRDGVYMTNDEDKVYRVIDRDDKHRDLIVEDLKGNRTFSESLAVFLEWRVIGEAAEVGGV